MKVSFDHRHRIDDHEDAEEEPRGPRAEIEVCRDLRQRDNDEFDTDMDTNELLEDEDDNAEDERHGGKDWEPDVEAEDNLHVEHLWDDGERVEKPQDAPIKEGESA